MDLNNGDDEENKLVPRVTLKDEPSFINLLSGFTDTPAIQTELQNNSATNPIGEELQDISGNSSKPVYKLVIVPSVKISKKTPTVRNTATRKKTPTVSYTETRRKTPTVSYIYTLPSTQLALKNEEDGHQQSGHQQSGHQQSGHQQIISVDSTQLLPVTQQTSHTKTLKNEKDVYQQGVSIGSAQFMPLAKQTSHTIKCATFGKKLQSKISNQIAHSNSKPDSQQKKPRPQRKYSDEQLRQFIEEERRKKIAWLFNESLKTYTCADCSKEFAQEREIVDHIKENHEEAFICFECNKKFPTAYCFSSHNRHHTDDPDTFKCHLCDFSTKRNNCMYIHYNKHYQRYKHECKTCGKRSMSTAEFREHTYTHSGSKPFICVVCNKAHRTSHNLRYHQIHKHTVGIEGEINSLKCPMCQRIFHKIETKDRHVARLHTLPRQTVKRVLCESCGKEFTDGYYLRVHKRLHSGEKPFSCEHCPKKFASRNTLLPHLRIHTGEKPYSCEYCGKFFNQRGAMMTHIKIHTGEKPFTCDCCNKAFITRTSLKSHRKVCMK